MQYSLVDYSQIDLGNRIDAEYYQPTYLHIQKKLLENNATPLKKFCSITGSAFYPAATHLYERGDLPFIRCVDCISYPIITTRQDNLFEKIPNDFAHENKNIKRLSKGEIVITKVGTPCYASIVHDIEAVALSRTVLGLKFIKNINPYYLVAFLRSKYGFLQLLRERELTIQFQLTLERVGNILVYTPINRRLEKLIADNFILFEEKQKNSENLNSQAQTLLLYELGLLSWQPKHRLAFVKNYSDAQQAGRMDAEYFQPKYEEIEKAIRSYKGGYSYIKDEFKQNKSTFKVDDKRTYHYVEIGDINVSSGEVAANPVEGAELPANAKRVLKKNDLVISKVRTYRGAIAIIDQDGYVGSGAFTVLHEEGRINKETLFTFLRSKPLLAWSLKPNTGTSYPVIVDEDILNLPIPLFSVDIQTQIQQKITESFNLRRQSKHLLECAKRAVEIAIEQDEQAAIRWLENELKETRGETVIRVNQQPKF